MKNSTKLGLALCTIGVVVGMALAQRQGFGRFGAGGGGGAMGLVLRPEVQKELKLTEDQIASLKTLGDDMGEKRKDAFGQLQGVAKEEFAEKMAEIMKPINDEANKKLATILKPEQSTRVKQLERQQAGLRAFTEKDVLAAVKLTDEQKDSIKTMLEDQRRDMEELRKDAGNDFSKFGEIMKKGAAMNKESLEKVSAMLTADQKKAWKELTGEPFEFKMDGFGGQGKGKGGFRKKDKGN